MRRLLTLFALCILLLVSACNGDGRISKSDFLSEISGVWRASDGGLFSIVYSGNKFRLLAADTAIPVSLGDLDQQNETVNLNVTLANGKPGIWTLRKIWEDKDKSTFHLLLTIHDGLQDQLSFVRKISSDDLNKIATLETNIRAGAVTAKAAEAQAAPPPIGAASRPAPAAAPAPGLARDPIRQDTQPANVAISAPQTAASSQQSESQLQNFTGSFAPSFDCSKVSTGPERLICTNKDLAEADVRMSQVYRTALSSSADRVELKEAQRAWNRTVRDACADVTCMLDAYNIRIAELAR